MSRVRLLRCSTRGPASRAVGIALVAVLALLSLVGGATRALCLDLGGHCAESAAAPMNSCHDQGPAGGFDAGCGSCVDVVVPREALAGGGRSEHGPGAPAAAAPPVAAEEAFAAVEPRPAAAPAAPNRGLPLHPSLRSTVLLI